MRFSSSVQLFTGRKAGGGGGDKEITNSAPRWVSKTFHIVKIKFPSLYRVFALKDMEDQTCPSSFTKEKFRRSRLSKHYRETDNYKYSGVSNEENRDG